MIFVMALRQQVSKDLRQTSLERKKRGLVLKKKIEDLNRALLLCHAAQATSVKRLQFSGFLGGAQRWTGTKSQKSQTSSIYCLYTEIFLGH